MKHEHCKQTHDKPTHCKLQNLHEMSWIRGKLQYLFESSCFAWVILWVLGWFCAVFCVVQARGLCLFFRSPRAWNLFCVVWRHAPFKQCLNFNGILRQETIEQHFLMNCSKIGHSYTATKEGYVIAVCEIPWLPTYLPYYGILTIKAL